MVRRGRLVVAYVLLSYSTGLAWAASQLALGVSLLPGLVGGTFFGLALGAFLLHGAVGRSAARVRLAPEDLTPEQRQAALDASGAGPLPADPAVLAEALRLSRAVLAETSPRGVVLHLAFCLAGAAAALVAGALASRWWWVDAVALLAAGTWVGLVRGRRLRRARLLEQGLSGTEGSGPSGPGPSASR